MSLEVYLVRHGKTVFNTTGRVQGWSDSPLMPEGVVVAEKLGRALAGKIDFDAAFSSTSPRAVDTAKLILASKGQNDLPLIQINELKEYCFGSFEGDLAENVHHMIGNLSRTVYRKRESVAGFARNVDYRNIKKYRSRFQPV